MRLSPPRHGRRPRAEILPPIFEEDEFSWVERRAIDLKHRGTWWRQHLDWINSQPLMLRPIIWLFWLTAAYFAILAGFTLNLLLQILLP